MKTGQRTIPNLRNNALSLLLRKMIEVAQLYTYFEFRKIKGLAMEPSALNTMLRCTLLPKVGNTDAICEKYYVAIKSILDGTKLNWVDFLVEELMWCKHEVKGSWVTSPTSWCWLSMRQL